MNLKKFFSELKRRNVYKVALTYAITSWLLAQIVALASDTFGAPDWVTKIVFVILIIGFPLVLILTWAYEMSPQGIIRTTSEDSQEDLYSGKKKKPLISNLFITVLALIIIGQFAYNKYSNKDAGSSTELEHSIAVLPFDDMSSGSDTQWFCDGVTEDISTHLSKIKDLTVISSTSTERYKVTDKSIPEIAKELGVAYIVEGSVRKQGNKVLITAQLIDSNDKQLWAENYDDNLDDVFKIQQDVSRKIVEQLKITISPKEEKILNTIQTNNVEAYQILLKGRSLADGRTKEGLEKSIELYKQAIDLDPNYAVAYAEMALSYLMLGTYRHVKFSEVEVKVEDLIKKALTIDPNTVRAFTVAAKLNMRHSNWKSAKINFEKALELNPNDATAHHHFSEYYKNKPIPDYENSLIQINLALRLEPLSMPANKEKFTLLIKSNRIDQAEEHFNKTSFLYKSDTKLWFESLIKVFQNKDWTEAIRFFEIELEKDPKNSSLYAELAFLCNNILNDKKRALEYAKLAVDINPTIYNTRLLIWILMLNKEWAEAKKMINENNYDDETTNMFLMDEMYLSDQPQKALEFYYKLDHKNPKLEILILSRMGDREKVNELMKDYEISYFKKAVIYANLNEKDSMYYYLNKISNKYFPLTIKYDIEFDPYKKEERYKEFLKNNYLPITY